MILEKFEDKILQCNKCKSVDRIFPFPHVLFNRNIDDLKLFIIGRNPGLEHDYSDKSINKSNIMNVYLSRWWNCKFAKYLRSIISEDILKSNTYMTNIVKCSTPNNRVPNINEKTSCFPFLQFQLKMIHPKVVLLFGSDAGRQLFKTHKVFTKIEQNNIIFYMLYHPAYFNYCSNNDVKETQKNLIIEAVNEFT